MFTKELPRIDTAKIADQLKAGRADLLSDASKHLGYRTPQPPSKGGFGCVLEDETTISMWEADAYGKE